MMLDGHIHMGAAVEQGSGEKLLEALGSAGLDGGMVISRNPAGAFGKKQEPYEKRLHDLITFCEGHETLFPCFWIDPVADDALKQVELAAPQVDAFKVICGTHFPGDERAMETYRAIAAHQKPILFHSGILWDGRPSSQYNMPHTFECLLEVPGLRFSLAHVSWPWCDECIAVMGKFMNALALRPDLSVEMFVDTTPGTPVRWRREVFEKLFTGDYDVLHSVIFGSDCIAESYNIQWTRDWLERDRAILCDLGVPASADFERRLFGENLLRFLGKKAGRIDRRLPQMAV